VRNAVKLKGWLPSGTHTASIFQSMKLTRFIERRLVDKPVPNDLPGSSETKHASDHQGKKNPSKDPIFQVKSKKSEKENAPVKPRSMKKKKSAQELPKVKWTAVPTFISRQDAEARIQVREFLLRFSNVVKISRAFLEELERIGGSDDSLEQDEDNLVDWVSEACVKAIVIGLLELHTHEDSEATEVSKKKVHYLHITNWIV
jgi:hypothetical protein